jgi:ATP-dependent RNA helicase SUPV3L1/SUV3
MTSSTAFSVDELLSGHSPLSDKYLQDARQIALSSQSLFWTSQELVNQLASVRGKLTLNRWNGLKWPFQIVNGRFLRPLTEAEAHQALITGNLEISLCPEPLAIESGTRLVRLLSWCKAQGRHVAHKNSLKFRTEWHHDYQFDSRLSSASRWFWLGLSENVVNELLSTAKERPAEHRLLLELAEGQRDFFSTTVHLKGQTFEVKQISRTQLFSPDFAFALLPDTENGFSSLAAFRQSISLLVEQRLNAVLDSNKDKLTKLPEFKQAQLVETLHAFPKLEGFTQAVTHALNAQEFESLISIELNLADRIITIEHQLELPSDRILSTQEYEQIKQLATSRFTQNFERLKSWSVKFDLQVLETPLLIKLLKQKPKQMKAAFIPLRDKLHGTMAMNELVLNDPRFSRYHDLYPARQLEREWIAYLGPTNSGKTHSSMEEMARVTHAVYLSPLRLMALENQERLEDMGIPCSLVTGEEEIIRPGATHFCCTVEEFARFKHQHWDVVIVDEVQMLTDDQRGWAWTDALVSAYTPRLIMTGPMLIQPSLERLALLCEDKLTVVEKKRLTPLGIDASPVRMEKIAAGSIIVAFSRKTVLDIKRILDMKGRTTAVVYGALSPVVRREQARRFRDGEAEIMIATDAIGMGLNLPAQSIYFYADRKFDGSSVRTLTSQEVKQIGGRAGRYGLSERGNIGAFSDEHLATIRNRYHVKDRDIELRKFAVRPNFDHLSTIAEMLNERSLLKVWLTFIRTVNYGESFVAVLPAELMEWIRQIDNPNIDLELRWIFACAPVHGGLEGYASQWLQEWLRCLHKGKPIVLPNYAPQMGLKGFEDALHMIDAYLHLARAIPEAFTEREKAEELRELFNEKTLKALTQTKAQSGKTRYACA